MKCCVDLTPAGSYVPGQLGKFSRSSFEDSELYELEFLSTDSSLAPSNTAELTDTRCSESPSFKLLPLSPLRFSFFSRDKERAPQRSAQLDGGLGPWAGKADVYTEQAQEALQHM